MEFICSRRSNLSPRAKTPLSLVALVGESFDPRGNRMAAGTLGQFTVLRQTTHTTIHAAINKMKIL